MKKSEFRALIREEIKKVLKEEQSFGADIEKQIRATRTAQQREFISWAKQEAAKRNIARLSFQGKDLTYVALDKLERSGILTPELMDTWSSAPEGSKENNLYQGLVVLIDRTI